MGLYKRCEHRGRARDRCTHAWWATFQHRGCRLRVSLQQWANRDIQGKTDAQGVYERFKAEVRAGTVKPAGATEAARPQTFEQFAEIYVERYVKANMLASADTIDYRMDLILEHFGPRRLTEITTADIEDFVARLKAPCPLAKSHKSSRVRRPATINRYLSLLGHMFNWAVGRGFIERTPFRRGTQALIRHEREDNRRHRRLSADEEGRLLKEAPSHLRPLIIAALDTGMRRGEMLALKWSDIDARPGWIRLRGETTKSRKTRWVPVSTTRLRAQLAFLRIAADGEEKSPDAAVFSNEVGEPIRYFATAWRGTMKRAGVEGLRWHDLRHEYASRLVERGVPLSQVRDLLGHASIVTTERYDNQTAEALMAAAKRLEPAQSGTKESQSAQDDTAELTDPAVEELANLLDDMGMEVGVSDGVRTRDFRSHSPALYR